MLQQMSLNTFPRTHIRTSVVVVGVGEWSICGEEVMYLKWDSRNAGLCVFLTSLDSAYSLSEVAVPVLPPACSVWWFLFSSTWYYWTYLYLTERKKKMVCHVFNQQFSDYCWDWATFCIVLSICISFSCSKFIYFLTNWGDFFLKRKQTAWCPVGNMQCNLQVVLRHIFFSRWW